MKILIAFSLACASVSAPQAQIARFPESFFTAGAGVPVDADAGATVGAVVGAGLGLDVQPTNAREIVTTMPRSNTTNFFFILFPFLLFCFRYATDSTCRHLSSVSLYMFCHMHIRNLYIKYTTLFTLYLITLLPRFYLILQIIF
jgi:hypothetical protein